MSSTWIVFILFVLTGILVVVAGCTAPRRPVTRLVVTLGLGALVACTALEFGQEWASLACATGVLVGTVAWSARRVPRRPPRRTRTRRTVWEVRLTVRDRLR